MMVDIPKDNGTHKHSLILSAQASAMGLFNVNLCAFCHCNNVLNNVGIYRKGEYYGTCRKIIQTKENKGSQKYGYYI